MRRPLSATLTAFISAYGVYTQYRLEFLLYMVSGMTPLIMMFVWIPLAEAGAIGGTSATWFAAYFLLVYGTRQVSPIWQIRHLDEEVRLGRLSNLLVKPSDPYWRLLGFHFADIAIRAPVVVLFVPAALWLSGAHEALTYANLPLFLWTAFVGALLHFHFEYLMGLTAFWTDQSVALEDFYITLFFLVGGFLVPLEMFPDLVRDAFELLPWPYIFSFPVEVALGARDGDSLVYGLSMQGGWLIGLLLLGRVLWHRGLRRYGAAGA